MKYNFTMLNFCTEYSSLGTINRKMKRGACFGTVFQNPKHTHLNTYIIKLHKLGTTLSRDKYNNACLADKCGIRNHLRIVKSIFKFNYRIKETDNFFYIKVKLCGNIIYHKYLLTWIRYLYEYPFNIFLMEAHKLKQLPKYKFESIINLFNLVGATSHIDDWGCSIHAIGNIRLFKELLTIEEIKEALKRERNGYINSIFPGLEDGNLCTLKEDFDTLHSLDYWESEEKFKARIGIYNKNYNILKNKKK